MSNIFSAVWVYSQILGTRKSSYMFENALSMLMGYNFYKRCLFCGYGREKPVFNGISH